MDFTLLIKRYLTNRTINFTWNIALFITVYFDTDLKIGIADALTNKSTNNRSSRNETEEPSGNTITNQPFDNIPMKY